MALATESAAWWNNGHLITARIAYDYIMDESPATMTAINSRLQFLKDSDASWTVNEQDHPMVECATFADFIKYKGGSYQKNWHFTDNPYLDQGGSISDYDITFDMHNVTDIMPGLANWLKEEGDYTSDFAYQTIMDHRYGDATEDDAKSTALRLLIHYAGDVHQPLHATSRYNSDYTGGDYGGNAVKLPSIDGASNLHAVWDSVIYTQPDDFPLPLSTANWEKLGDVAKDIVAEYPMDHDSTPSHLWDRESFEIAEKDVYNGVEAGVALTEAYKTEAVKDTKTQLSRGGRRLADLLIDIHESSSDMLFLQN